jgi:hypothetical protein
MPQHQITPSHSGIVNRPLCVICGTQMWLACVEAEGPTHDKRTFECPVCSTSEIELVKFN